MQGGVTPSSPAALRLGLPSVLELFLGWRGVYASILFAQGLLYEGAHDTSDTHGVPGKMGKVLTHGLSGCLRFGHLKRGAGAKF